MATLEGKILKKDSADYVVPQLFIQIECLNADMERFQKKKAEVEALIALARSLGYKTDAELDLEEQQRYAAEKALVGKEGE